jgi:hypothetical protein
MRVRPLKEHVRKFVRHPTAGRFRPSQDTADWPNDAFTQRRIRDGDIEVVDQPEQEQPGRSEEQ